MRTHALFLGSAAIALFLGVARSALAEAHHSGAGFNSDKVIELTGTIKEFQFTNPHTWIQIIVEDNKGAKTSGASSGAAPIRWDARASVRRPFPPGAKVTMRLRPMLNGAPAGAFVGAKFTDGKTVGRWE